MKAIIYLSWFNLFGCCYNQEPLPRKIQYDDAELQSKAVDLAGVDDLCIFPNKEESGEYGKYCIQYGDFTTNSEEDIVRFLKSFVTMWNKMSESGIRFNCAYEYRDSHFTPSYYLHGSSGFTKVENAPTALKDFAATKNKMAIVPLNIAKLSLCDQDGWSKKYSAVLIMSTGDPGKIILLNPDGTIAPDLKAAVTSFEKCWDAHPAEPIEEEKHTYCVLCRNCFCFYPLFFISDFIVYKIGGLVYDISNWLYRFSNWITFGLLCFLWKCLICITRGYINAVLYEYKKLVRRHEFSKSPQSAFNTWFSSIIPSYVLYYEDIALNGNNNALECATTLKLMYTKMLTPSTSDEVIQKAREGVAKYLEEKLKTPIVPHYVKMFNAHSRMSEQKFA